MNFENRKRSNVQRRRLQRLKDKEERLLEPKRPSFIGQKLRERTEPVRLQVEQKVPRKAVEKSAALLQAAFEKSFDVVLEKGSGLIAKTCSEQKLLEQYERFSGKPLSNWELSKLAAKAAARASANVVFSTVQGGLMGAIGIGLPDVPIFLAAVFKTLFEISLRFGFPCGTREEQLYQMLVICAAVGEEADRRTAVADLDLLAREIQIGAGVSFEWQQVKRRAAEALCAAALTGKVVQGVPVVGVYGGFRNGALLRQIGAMAAVKYQQRMLSLY